MRSLGIRARVALALVLVVVPAALAFVLFTQRSQREASLETAYETAVASLEDRRELCERRPRRVLRRERRVVAMYDAALTSRDPEAPPVPEVAREAFAAGEVAVLDPRTPGRALLRMPWDDGPCAVLLVDLPRARRATPIRDVALMLTALGLSLAAALVALGGPLRRLAALAEAARAPGGATQLKVPAGTKGSDEVGVLATALDEAASTSRRQLTELEAKTRALRGYVDGTTHDLAVPLTVLSGQLAELQGTPGVDPRALEGAIASTSYLHQLTANLAAAARLEGEQPAERRPVDLGAVVDRVIARLTPIARHRKVALAASLPDTKVVIEGDELLLERALGNLVHNAIRHRDPAEGGHVAVIVRSAPLSIVVKGDGAKVDDATLAALRAGETPADASRTGGRGLGLSIVRQVAERHGLSLSFARAEDGTLEVTLAQPTSRPGST